MRGILSLARQFRLKSETVLHVRVSPPHIDSLQDHPGTRQHTGRTHGSSLGGARLGPAVTTER